MRCKNGGFVDPEVPLTENGAISLRNPAGRVGCSVLRQVLLLAKTFNDLWAPQYLARFAPSYTKVLDMLEIEKLNVLGTTPSRCSSQGPPGDDSNYSESGIIVTKDQAAKSGKHSDIYKAQCFIYEQYESIYHLLAQYCVNFGHEFYRQSQLAEFVVSSVLQGLHHVPDYRLRAVIRTFLKALINKCPKSHFSIVLVPIFKLFCPYMLTRLTDRWKQVEAMRELPTFDEDNTDSAEVITDVICRQITREYLDVIKAMLTSGGGSDVSVSTTTTELVSGSNENIKAALAVTNGHNLSLSELGSLILQHETLGQCVLETLLCALVWPDSQTSGRASSLLEAVLPTLSTSGQLGSSGAAHVMYTVLSAIQVLGQHEANKIALINLAVLTYELLRPSNPSVAEMLSKVPGCNVDDLKRFDSRAMQLAAQRDALAHNTTNGTNVNNIVTGGSSRGGAPDKVLKTMFKKLIDPFIEKDVAQRFKKEVLIKNLPTLQLLKTRQKTPSLDDTESNDIGLTSLFGSDTTTQQNGSARLNSQINNYTVPSQKMTDITNSISKTIPGSQFPM
jgi:exportin-5